MPLPLANIRVLDFSHVVAGPLASNFLAQLGAEVIKIESLTGDISRAYGVDDPLDGSGPSPTFVGLNCGKKSISIDLKRAEAREIVSRLVETSQVVLENFRPGVIDRLGFSYDECRKLRPDVIYCSISGYGQSGPMKNYPAIDNVVQATSGMMSVSGEEGAPPSRVGVPAVDTFTATNAALAIMAALVRRERFGVGEYLDVAMLDSALVLLTGAALPYLIEGELPKRTGNTGFSAQPTAGMFECADNRLISLGVVHQAGFEKLCEVLDLPGLVADSRFTTISQRKANSADLTQILQRRFAEETALHWETLLSSHGIPCGMVRNVAEALELQSVRERGLRRRVTERSPESTMEVLGPGFVMGSEPFPSNVAVPSLGGHTREILESIGYDETRIRQLAAAGVIAGPEIGAPEA